MRTGGQSGQYFVSIFIFRLCSTVLFSVLWVGTHGSLKVDEKNDGKNQSGRNPKEIE
jgi:hypothetical protein